LDTSEPATRAIDLAILLEINTGSDAWWLVGAIAGIVLLIISSGLFSASENSFFSITKSDKQELVKSDNKSDKAILDQLSRPKELLATILIANNFVNVTLIILSSMMFVRYLNLNSEIWQFLVQVVLVTFILLLFGEVIPKIYATKNNIKIARFMARPLSVIQKILYPLVFSLVRSTRGIDNRIKKKNQKVSMEELHHAIDITSEEHAPQEEKDILKGIVNYGNINASQIMRPRMDITAIEFSESYIEVMKIVRTSGYSRIPVYKEKLDDIAGLLYVKDLLEHLNEDEKFDWSKLVREALFIPENKKIDDLLSEFRDKRIHAAIVVDEYGGTSGLVTMEDILEEIFGEINDEFDINKHSFSILDKDNFLMDGKLMLNDVCKILDLNINYFDKLRGDADTLGGLIQEISGKIPEKNEMVKAKNIDFLVESADKRRIKRVKVTLNRIEEDED
jgi:putative hemolysin